MLLIVLNTPNALWYFLGGVAVGIGLCLAYYFIKREIDKPKNEPTRFVDPDSRRGTGKNTSSQDSSPIKPERKPVHQPTSKPEQQTVAQPTPKPEHYDAIEIEIKKMIKHLGGCMNTLTDLVEEGDVDEGNILFTNFEQIIIAHGSDELKKWFSTFTKDRKQWGCDLYKSKSSEMLELLKRCGVRKSTELKIRWDKFAQRHYRKLDSSIQDGQVCVVVAHCWIYENDVFEKGLVKSNI